MEIQECAERLFGLRSTDSDTKTVVMKKDDWLKRLVLRVSSDIKLINITTQRQRHIELAPRWESDDEMPDVDDDCPRSLCTESGRHSNQATGAVAIPYWRDVNFRYHYGSGIPDSFESTTTRPGN